MSSTNILCDFFKNIPFKTYLKLIEPVFQDVNLFAYTLKENIAFDRSELIEEDSCDQLLSDCGLDSRIHDLPEGLDSYYSKEFDESGINLSGGEKQKLSIARAVF